MSKVDSNEPEISPEMNNLLARAFQQIGPEETLVTNCQLRTGAQRRKGKIPASVYVGLAAVILVCLSIIFLVPGPRVSEPVFIPEQTITLDNGAQLIISKGTIVKIRETEGEVILDRGWLQLNCSGSHSVKVITPPNTQIKRGNDFLIDAIQTSLSSNRVFLVSGSIELTTE